jgi:hypothetical protein
LCRFGNIARIETRIKIKIRTANESIASVVTTMMSGSRLALNLSLLGLMCLPNWIRPMVLHAWIYLFRFPPARTATAHPRRKSSLLRMKTQATELQRRRSNVIVITNERTKVNVNAAIDIGAVSASATTDTNLKMKFEKNAQGSLGIIR